LRIHFINQIVQPIFLRFDAKYTLSMKQKVYCFLIFWIAFTLNSGLSGATNLSIGLDSTNFSDSTPYGINVLTIYQPKLGFEHSTLNIKHSNYNIQNSIINFKHSPYPIRRVHHFFGPIFEVRPFNGNIMFNGGVQGALIINRQFFAGAFGYKSLNSFADSRFPGSLINHWQVGGIFGWYYYKSTKTRNKRFHPAFFIQAGGAKMWLENARVGDDQYIFIKPCAEYEINLSRIMRLGLGAGYTLTYLGQQLYTNRQLSGPSVMINLKVRWYG